MICESRIHVRNRGEHGVVCSHETLPPECTAFADAWYKNRQDVGEALERGTAASRIYYGDPVASGTVRAFRLADLSMQ